MKAFLRLMGRVRPEIKLSAEQSAESCRPTALNRRLPTKYQLSPKTYKRIPLILFILVFVSCGAAKAQEVAVQATPAAKAENKAIDLSTLGVQIGEKVPDVTNNIHNYKSSTAKLSDFKGKLLILDFWATWCSPCVAMIPKMDSLQKEFGDQVQFLSVTYQKESNVLSFMQALEKKHGKGYNIPMVMDDTELRGLFPHKVLPHYVWIDADQKYLGATEAKELTRENISQLLEGSNLTLQAKRDTYIQYDNSKPLFIDNNGGSPQKLLHYSLFLSGYQEGLPFGRSIRGDSENGIKITSTNECIISLFSTAYGGRTKHFDDRNTIYNIREKERVVTDKTGKEAIDWLRSNGYTYELLAPFHYGDSVFNIMLDDLHAYFKEYKTEVKSIRQRQLIMKRTSDLDKLASKGGISKVNPENYNFSMVNLPIQSLVQRLNVVYLQGQDLTLIDKTQYKGPIDIILPVDLSNIQELNQALASYDLVIEEEMNEVEHLIISDK